METSSTIIGLTRKLPMSDLVLNTELDGYQLNGGHRRGRSKHTRSSYWKSMILQPLLVFICLRRVGDISIKQSLFKDGQLKLVFKDNCMINRRVSLFYQEFLKSILPYGLSVYLTECQCSVSRH